MEPITPDTYPGLFFAYTFIWVVLVAYIHWLIHRVRKLERRDCTKQKDT